LAVPDLKRGRVGSALNALTTAAGLLSMATAAVLGEFVRLRMIYVLAGLITSAAGVVALFVLVEPDVQPGDTQTPITNAGKEVSVPTVAEAEAK
ncbi:MAG: hypothetical protein PVG56_15720, partial [Anaerolineae bacterium]